MASKGSSSGDLWLQVNKDLFLNDLFIPFKEEHYKEKDYRKLRDKFNAMKKEATKMMESGNKSKFGGDFSEKFKLLQQAIEESNQADNERQLKKDNDEAEKKLIQETGDRIMNGKTPKRDKGKLIVHLDGTVSDNRMQKRSNAFEDYVLEKMTKKNNDVNERDVLGKLQRWIKSNNQTTYDLIGALDVFAMP